MKDYPWLAEAHRLRAEGLGWRRISKALGVRWSTIWTALNPDRARAIRQRHYRKNKADCYACSRLSIWKNPEKYRAYKTEWARRKRAQTSQR